MSKRRFPVIFTGLITIALVAVVIYLGAVGVKVVSGVSAVEGPPDHTVRLQVVYAGDDTGEAREAADVVKGLADETLAIDVVSVESYAIRTVTRTVVVSRMKDETGARLLAGRLGLDPSSVIYQPLEHNTDQVSASLIVGPDFDDILSTIEVEKEK